MFKKLFHHEPRKVFCLSMQRTGTTSTGMLFRELGLCTAGWKESAQNGWPEMWYRGDFEGIFQSAAFRNTEAFEDGPWFAAEFYKVLYHRFPQAKFVLLRRDADSWFRSMQSHSGGKTLGDPLQHCKAYRREPEYYAAVDRAPDQDVTLMLSDCEQHYKDVYTTHNREVVDFFAHYAPDALFVGDLADPDKWRKISAFLGKPMPESFKAHRNSTDKKAKRQAREKRDSAQ